MPDHSHDGFDRVLVEDYTKIQSTCQTCGFVIVVGLNEGVQEQEQDHATRCPRTQKNFPAIW